MQDYLAYCHQFGDSECNEDEDFSCLDYMEYEECPYYYQDSDSC